MGWTGSLAWCAGCHTEQNTCAGAYWLCLQAGSGQYVTSQGALSNPGAKRWFQHPPEIHKATEHECDKITDTSCCPFPGGTKLELTPSVALFGMCQR